MVRRRTKPQGMGGSPAWTWPRPLATKAWQGAVVARRVFLDQWPREKRGAHDCMTKEHRKIELMADRLGRNEAGRGPPDRADGKSGPEGGLPTIRLCLVRLNVLEGKNGHNPKGRRNRPYLRRRHRRKPASARPRSRRRPRRRDLPAARRLRSIWSEISARRACRKTTLRSARPITAAKLSSSMATRWTCCPQCWSPRRMLTRYRALSDEEVAAQGMETRSERRRPPWSRRARWQTLWDNELRSTTFAGHIGRKVGRPRSAETARASLRLSAC